MTLIYLPLERIQIAALRKADDIVVRHYGEGQSTLEAIKRANKTPANPFSEEQRVVIQCATRWSDYTPGHMYGLPESFHGFEMIHAAQYHDTWKTVASLLQPGDVLTVHWIRAAWQEHEPNPDKSLGAAAYRLKCGGHRQDRVELIVVRGDKAKSLTFNIGESICPEHSLARAIRNVCYKSAEAA
jgi:hypothetical protein